MPVQGNAADASRVSAARCRDQRARPPESTEHGMPINVPARVKHSGRDGRAHSACLVGVRIRPLGPDSEIIHGPRDRGSTCSISMASREAPRGAGRVPRRSRGSSRGRGPRLPAGVSTDSSRCCPPTAGLKPAQVPAQHAENSMPEGTGITRHVRFSKPFSRLFERQPQRR